LYYFRKGDPYKDKQRLVEKALQRVRGLGKRQTADFYQQVLLVRHQGEESCGSRLVEAAWGVPSAGKLGKGCCLRAE